MNGIILYSYYSEIFNADSLIANLSCLFKRRGSGDQPYSNLIDLAWSTVGRNAADCLNRVLFKSSMPKAVGVVVSQRWVVRINGRIILGSRGVRALTLIFSRLNTWASELIVHTVLLQVVWREKRWFIPNHPMAPFPFCVGDIREDQKLKTSYTWALQSHILCI